MWHYAWDDDTDPAARQQVNTNLQDDVVPAVVGSALQRQAFDLDLVRDWHRRMLVGVTDDGGRCPPAAAGRFRGPALPAVVGVANTYGTPPAHVAHELQQLESVVVDRVTELDIDVSQGSQPSTTDEMDRVFRTAALLHGEWIRIHPFVNGNGRTARLWCNWVLIRYGLPPLLSVRPRPTWPATLMTRGQEGYAFAAALSMKGNHDLMRSELKHRFREATGP